MRLVVRNPEEGKRRAQQARKDVVEKFSIQQVCSVFICLCLSVGLCENFLQNVWVVAHVSFFA